MKCGRGRGCGWGWVTGGLFVSVWGVPVPVLYFVCVLWSMVVCGYWVTIAWWRRRGVCCALRRPDDCFDNTTPRLENCEHARPST